MHFYKYVILWGLAESTNIEEISAQIMMKERGLHNFLQTMYFIIFWRERVGLISIFAFKFQMFLQKCVIFLQGNIW